MQSSDLTPTQLLGVFADFFESQRIPYHVVGSMASMAYGEPRMTIDIDMVADLDRRHVSAIIAAFPSPDYYISETAALEAVRRNSQFNAIHIPSGLKVDVFIPLPTEFSRTQQSRVRRIIFGQESSALYAAPEDVILHKLIYFQLSGGASQKHVRDIGGMMRVSREEIDVVYIREWASKLNVLNEWDLVLARLNEDADPNSRNYE